MNRSAITSWIVGPRSAVFRYSLAVATALTVFLLHSNYLIISGVISLALIAAAVFASALWGGWLAGLLCAALIAGLTRAGLTHGELPLERSVTDLLWSSGLVLGAIVAGDALRRAYRDTELDELRYADLLRGMKGSVLVWTARADDQAIVEINNIRDRANPEKILGHPVDRWLMGRDFWIRIVHSEDREKTLHALRNAAKKPGAFTSVEHRLVGADRNPVWFRTSIQSTSERLPELHAVSIDIRDSKQWEESYGEQVATSQALEASLIHGAITVDADGRIRAANAPAREFFGMEEARLTGSLIRDRLSPLLMPDASDWLFDENGQLISAIRSGVPHVERFRPLRHANDEYRSWNWLIRSQPLRHLDGSLNGAVISFHPEPLHETAPLEEREAG